MKNKLMQTVTGQKSIRLRMFWYLGFSLIIALVVTILAANVTNRLEHGYQLFYIPLFAFTFAFFISFYLFTRLTVNYLLIISDGLIRIAEGNLNYRVPVLQEDELGTVARNINEMAKQLDRKIQKEREIEQSKMELITGISHDLRTPLTSIIGYLDLLQNKSYHSQAEQDRFIQNTHNKAVQLKKLIDDLFEYTRLTSGNPKLSMQTINMKELLEQLLFEFKPIAQEHELDLHQELPHEHVEACIDIEKFARAMDNLLMNALKFSVKPGQIAVSLQSSGSRLIITLQNKGRPISEEQERHLFDRFYMADESRSGQTVQAGSGLGLSIAKNIIELHGGSIALTHVSGVFTFSIELPVTIK
ncbi:sensor histidine kinase [Paenibacillus sp. TAB 01]|uniref:sensor histidine kinase n=1 Tax=Paenibacillus sp. TAB 01 TaxID=3368988 RepID=UPI00374FF6CE